LRKFEIKGNCIGDEFMNFVEQIIIKIKKDNRKTPITLVIDILVNIRSIIETKSQIEKEGIAFSKKI
jgi:hypothetical protein